MSRVLACGFLVALFACGSTTTTAPAESPPAGSRREIDVRLRARIAGADPCDKLVWLNQLAQGGDGMEQEVAEELEAQRTHACHERDAPPTPVDPPPDVPVAPKPPPVDMVACSHARAEVELKRRGGTPDAAAIEAAFSHCVFDRVTECQLALNTDVDHAIACWERGAWPELPADIDRQDIVRAGLCLHEIKVIEDDIRSCATKSKRDACVAPYAKYAPKCGMLDANDSWQAFATHDEVDRKTKEEAQRAADREARLAKEAADREAKLAKEAADKAEKLAKETERCHGHSTLEFATKLKAEPGLGSPKGCQYDVVGRVVSTNNVFVAIVDPRSGGSMHLLRTREKFADGTSVDGRTAVYDGIENVELADGNTQPLAVFKLTKK